MENSFFGTLILQCLALLKESGLYHLLNRCFQRIQKVWQKSGIYSILFESPIKASIESSLTYKIFSLPFRGLNYVAEQSDFKGIKESRLLGWIREYLKYILQINSRFFGGFLIVLGIFYTAATQAFSFYTWIAVGLGFIGIILNIDGINVLAHSTFVKWGLAALDFKIVPLKKRPSNKYSLLYGSVIGTLTGVLIFFISPIKALFLLVGVTTLFFMFYKPEYGLYLTVFLTPI